MRSYDSNSSSETAVQVYPIISSLVAFFLVVSLPTCATAMLWVDSQGMDRRGMTAVAGFLQHNSGEL
jgi:hypothetical protein